MWIRPASTVRLDAPEAGRLPKSKAKTLGTAVEEAQRALADGTLPAVFLVPEASGPPSADDDEGGLDDSGSASPANGAPRSSGAAATAKPKKRASGIGTAEDPVVKVRLSLSPSSVRQSADVFMGQRRDRRVRIMRHLGLAPPEGALPAMLVD
jgi:hypothetical protein